MAEYLFLMKLGVKLDRLVDISNHPDAKGFEFINRPEHPYINELESVLMLFED